MISTKTLPGAKMLLWSAALLLVGGPLLGLLFGSLEMAALAFEFGAAHLGLGQLWASENRGGRLVGFTLVLAGAFTVVDGAIWVLS
jgi:hypothetical protein